MDVDDVPAAGGATQSASDGTGEGQKTADQAGGSTRGASQDGSKDEGHEDSNHDDNDEDEELEFDSPSVGGSFSGYNGAGDEELLPDLSLDGDQRAGNAEGTPGRGSKPNAGSSDSGQSVQGSHNGQQGESGDDDDDDSEDDDDDEEEEEGVQGLTTSEREILTLLAVDKKLASVLDLAATALSGLHPSPSSTDESSSVAASAEDPLKSFQHHAGEYYKVLDDIQLTLRASIHQVSKARIPPRTLQDPQASLGSVLRGTIAHGALVEGDNVGLSLGATWMEEETWKDIASCLEDLRQRRMYEASQDTVAAA